MGQGPGYSIALTKVTCLTCGSAENDFQLECSLYATEASQPDSLRFAQRNFVPCAVVELGGSVATRVPPSVGRARAVHRSPSKC